MKSLFLAISSLFLVSTAHAQTVKPVEHSTCQATATGHSSTMGANVRSFAIDPFHWEEFPSIVPIFEAKGFKIKGRGGQGGAQDGDLNIHIGMFCEQNGSFARINCTVGVNYEMRDSSDPKGFRTIALRKVRRTLKKYSQLRELFDIAIQEAADGLPICETSAP